ncbi:MAG TPA: LuxR C-terminal-related transcriptional regulator [Nakamurella sp.]|jgi:DNA-binding NarL/FixJ family response regulator|nr:LuxR C-terminal-related transcriptional regulator [Nakamurella sp.]
MTSTAGELAAAARSAMVTGEWQAAREYFAALVEQDPTPEALAGLGDTLWWLGEVDQAIAHLERAYTGFRRRNDPAQSALTAVGLYLNYRVSLGNIAAARGWLARAERLVRTDGLAAVAGWVSLLRGHDCSDPAAAETWSRRAREAGAAHDDPDLELCAISQLGASLQLQGRLDEGAELLDEAMAASLAGECRRPHTVVFTSCTLISACAQTADVDHVLQWVRAADTFTRQFGSPHLYLQCRVHYGSVLFDSGDWAGAEREFEAALTAGARAERALQAEVCACLAQLRLAQGRPEEAERLLDGLHDYGCSSAVLADLELSRGDTAAARRIAVRRLRELDGQAADRPDLYRSGVAVAAQAARLWDLVARASTGEESAGALHRLTELADRTATPQLRARALRCAGTVHRDAASLESAVSLFTRLRLPWEAARSRMELARLLDGADAVAEARSALAGFTALGAAREADEAAARLRELGVSATRGGPSGLGELTQRELEVLDLLGEGLSNLQLAERLFLSRKTIERHVRNVLFKLGLRNRAEAAAYVVRHRLQSRSTN